MNGKTASNLAIRISIAAFVWGAFFISARNVQSIRVVGQGVKTITSDIIKWNMSINRTTNVAYKSEGPSWIQEDLIKVKKYLASNGIEEKDILVEPVSSYANYGNNGVTGYSFSQRIEVKSGDIEKIEKLALDNKALAKQDIYLQYSDLEYFVSNLAELKAEMLALATVDAKARAEEIAKSSGNKICGLLSAKTGVFQIRKPLSMDISDYGIYNTSSKEKEIAVTVNATFKIK